MGFEITYFYKEADEAPGTYKEEVLSKTTKIGKFEENVSLDFLAGKIISQLARRNILIVDIEIYEFAKKKVSYKETPNGIFIKNKKFSFESGALVNSEENENEELEEVLQNEQLLEKLKKVLNVAEPKLKNICVRNNTISNDKRFLRQEVYDPELLAKAKAEQRGYKFTVGKKYPIYLEKSLGAGLNYLTRDDSGREVEVSSECFVVPPAGLSFDEEGPQYHGAASQEVDLWKNQSVDNNMPDIRR
jgi:hypothetical protein